MLESPLSLSLSLSFGTRIGFRVGFNAEIVETLDRQEKRQLPAVQTS